MIDYKLIEFLIIVDNCKTLTELQNIDHMVFKEGLKFDISLLELRALRLVMVDKLQSLKVV